MEELPSLLSIHLAWGGGPWPHPQFQREKYMIQDQSIGYPGLRNRFSDGHVTSARPIRQYLQPLLKLLANGGSTTCVVKLVSKPRPAHIIFPPRRRSLPKNEANTEKKQSQEMKKEKVLAPLFEHLDPALPDIIYICNFHLFSKFTFCLEPVWASFLPWNQESWLITSSGKTVTAALVPSVSAFFFLLPPQLPLYKLRKFFSLWLSSLAPPIRSALWVPPSLSLSQSMLIANLKKPFCSALTPISNVHHTTCCYTILCCFLATSFLYKLHPQLPYWILE